MGGQGELRNLLCLTSRPCGSQPVRIVELGSWSALASLLSAACAGAALGCRVTAAPCATRVAAGSSFTGAGTSSQGTIKTASKVSSSGLVWPSHSSSCRHFSFLCVSPSSLDTCPTRRCCVPAAAVTVWLKSSWAVWRQMVPGLVQSHCICPG